jgi:E3 ubiquitin-protein ligase HERC1
MCLSQESITSIKWDPTGQMLLTCAKEDVVKLWSSPGSGSNPGAGWKCLQSLPHPAQVNGVAWCGLTGHGAKPLNMLATYVWYSTGLDCVDINSLNCTLVDYRCL